MIQKEVEFENKDKEMLVGIMRIPDEDETAPAVILCHGFTDNKDRELILDLANTISNYGFISLRFDQVGHGESEGKFMGTSVTKQVNDLIAAIEFLETIPQVDRKKIGVIGHSLGGIVGLIAAAEDKRIKAIMTLATRADAMGVVTSRFSEYEINDWKKKGFTTEPITSRNLAKVFLDDLEKQDLIKDVSKLVIPHLIVQGTNDKRVHIEEARRLSLHSKNSTLELIDNANHKFTNEEHRDYITRLMCEWFNKELK